MKKKNVLFVCTGNINRSKTAEELFKEWERLKVKSAGIYWAAKTPLSRELIDWADIIFVMEELHNNYIANWFPDALGKVVILGIEDVYITNDPRLITILKKNVIPYLKRLLKK
ncbi:MAG: phosphotyrosine protein phosphatase [Candidatus Helarchaeota archaeon]|nr:phosphotyrosine protein phosphatase [Candidatus Helarchaeota archaeon]